MPFSIVSELHRQLAATRKTDREVNDELEASYKIRGEALCDLDRLKWAVIQLEEDLERLSEEYASKKGARGEQDSAIAESLWQKHDTSADESLEQGEEGLGGAGIALAFDAFGRLAPTKQRTPLGCGRLVIVDGRLVVLEVAVGIAGRVVRDGLPVVCG